MTRLVRYLPVVALWAILIAVLYDFSVDDQDMLPWIMAVDAVVVAATVVVIWVRTD